VTPTARQPASRPFRVALTGGIASGKTTVADLFAAHGVPLIDTDVIAREVVEPGQPALTAVAQDFGSDVLDRDGRLDRRRLRAIIFGDATARGQVEAIRPPAIRPEMERPAVARAPAGTKVPGERRLESRGLGGTPFRHQYRALPGVRGNGMTSRTLASPVT